MTKITLDSKIIKNMFSFTFRELLTQSSFRHLPILNWSDRIGRGDARHYKKRDKEPFTGMMILDDVKFIRSLGTQFRGIKIGPEIFASSYRSNFLGYLHGLIISLNTNSYLDKDIEKLYSLNPSPPESITLKIFGTKIGNTWYRKAHASKFSVKFYDQFLKESLVQENIINALEAKIISTKQYLTTQVGLKKPGATFGDAVYLTYMRDLLQLFRSINNFESFLCEDMNRLKNDFKGLKSINYARDCANLLFIYNPLFREVMDYAFEQYYYHDADEWYAEVQLY